MRKSLSEINEACKAKSPNRGTKVQPEAKKLSLDELNAGARARTIAAQFKRNPAATVAKLQQAVNKTAAEVAANQPKVKTKPVTSGKGELTSLVRNPEATGRRKYSMGDAEKLVPGWKQMGPQERLTKLKELNRS